MQHTTVVTITTCMHYVTTERKSMCIANPSVDDVEHITHMLSGNLGKL